MMSFHNLIFLWKGRMSCTIIKSIDYCVVFVNSFFQFSNSAVISLSEMKFKIYLSSLGLITETTWNVIDWFADVQGKICLDPLVSMQKKNISLLPPTDLSTWTCIMTWKFRTLCTRNWHFVHSEQTLFYYLKDDKQDRIHNLDWTIQQSAALYSHIGAFV